MISEKIFGAYIQNTVQPLMADMREFLELAQQNNVAINDMVSAFIGLAWWKFIGRCILTIILTIIICYTTYRILI